MTVIEEIDDYIEYLVEEEGIRSAFQLNREQATKLGYLILMKNNMFKVLITIMQKTIRNYIEASSNKKIR